MCGPVPGSYVRGVELINELILQAVASPWLLVVLFAVTVIDGFFPPVPSETVLVAAAAVAASAGAWQSVIPMVLVAAAGAMIGDNIAYGLGRGIGTTRFRWMRRPRVAGAFARAQHALDRRGAGLILGARYIPVGRVAVNMSAGALGYPRRRFVPLSAVGALSWAVYSAVIGVVAGRWLEEQPLLGAVLGIVFALALGFAIDRVVAVRRRRAGSAGSPAGAEPEEARAHRAPEPMG